MLIPLIVLSIGAVLAGFVFHGYFIEPSAGEEFWKGALAFREHLMHEMHGVPLIIKLSATIAMLLGLLTATMYVIGAMFAALWLVSFLLGKRLEDRTTPA